MSADVTETTGFYEFLAWFEVNRKRIYTIAGAVAAIALVVAFIVWQNKQKEIQAHAELLRLGLPMMTSEGEKSPSASEYLKVAEKFSGTQAAQMALLKAAEISYSDARYNDALDYYKKFVSLHASSKMAPIAALGIAACQESQNNLEEALKTYQSVIAQYPDEPVASQSKLAVARIQITKKQFNEALKIYDEILKGKSRSVFTMEATTSRDYLLLKHPELTPAVTTASVTGTPTVSNKPSTNSTESTTSKTNTAASTVSTNKPATAKP